MRNIFDQYTQPENRVTHALLTALDQDRSLLSSFLRDLVGVKPPTDPKKLTVLEQRYPGDTEPDESDLERRGIPDGWIFDENAWCLFIESKVLIKLTSDQIERHLRTARRRGFETVVAVVITPVQTVRAPAGTILLEWKQVYCWLKRHQQREWARRAADYLEVAEAKLIEASQLLEGTLTSFSGFPFGADHPFTWLEGKRVLGLAMNELRSDPRLSKAFNLSPNGLGRPAITGRQENRVWDFISLAEPTATDNDAFTYHPHLTLAIGPEWVEAMVTIPNGLSPSIRRPLVDLGEEGFKQTVKAVVRNLGPLLKKCEGARPLFRGVQRRYPSQRAKPFYDATLEFDLRTAVEDSGPPKLQPTWLSAGYSAFVQKRGSNYQIQLGVQFPYDRCPEVAEASSLTLIRDAWIGCKPILGSTHEQQ
ncbi:hypothetical protein [Rhodoplanes sp. SY1]|uniref:hypothetical protein n=1 Tax=Rhodoplanes sp. SY1 TaxID=3166646 RepID=UPI0038B5369B